MKNVKRILSVLLVACMLLAMPVYVAADVEDTTGVVTDGAITSATDDTTDAPTALAPTYMEYYEQIGGKTKPTNDIVLGVTEITGVASGTDEALPLTEKDGKTGVVVSEDNAWVEWTVTVPSAGIYNLMPNYYPLADGGRTITLKVTVDGQSPFIEAQTLSLPRIWVDGGKVTQDEFGNDIRPSQVEKPHWNAYSFLNELGMYDDPYFFYFEAGTHVIRIERIREALAIETLTLHNSKKLPTYDEYVAAHKDGKNPTGEAITQQAELPLEKTDSTLYALIDHQDAGTTPTHPYHMVLNTIGGTNWGTTGQSITWEVDVEEAGWYKFALRARQRENQGLISYRNLSINGEVPFEEAMNIPFEYDTEWGVFTLGGDENPKLLYLEPGDKLTLTVSSGKLSNVLREIQQTVLDMNEIYRKIIVVTGTSPDIYQDYYLEDELDDLADIFPELADMPEEDHFRYAFHKLRDTVTHIADEIIAVTGKTGSQTSNLLETAEKLEVYAGKSYEITADLGSFKSSIESLSSLLLSFGQQPVEVDCFYFVPVETKTPNGKAGGWSSFVYSVEKFWYSFFSDYQSKGAEGTVEAWVSTGRDQMQIVSSMITDFTAATKTKVRLSLVNTHTVLIEATMAGKGPDVALMIDSGEIINLSMRGALVDLEERYNVFETMGGTENLTEAAWKRFRYYNGKTHGIYGIPETQTWPMIFYRTDIFEELKLTPPETWDEYYEMLRTLQGQNMNAGMVETSSGTPGVSGSIDTFQSILFQKGSTYYNEDLTATLFDQTPAYEAFEQWADFYGKYGIDRSIDFYNRFRTGDVPIGFSSYGTYNQLQAAAPELRGLWKMTVIPGTVQEDGTINHASASGGSGCMLMSASINRGVADKGFEFLSWWTDTDQQIRYGKELEATMGVAARYAPADLVALQNMGWTADELAILLEQRAQTQNVFSIPGDYLLARSLTNALRSTLDHKLEPRRTLAQYNRDINAEITRKRKEFGLDK